MVYKISQCYQKYVNTKMVENICQQSENYNLDIHTICSAYKTHSLNKKNLAYS